VEGARGELDVRGAVLPGLLQLEDHHASAGAREVAQAVVRKRRAEEVAEQSLAALVIVGGDGHLGVEVEAVDPGLAAGGQDHLPVELVVIGRVLHGAAAARRLAVRVRERGLVVGDRERVGAGLEELVGARHDAGEDRLHLARARRGRDEEGVVLAEGAVEEEGVQVHVQAEVGAEALDHEERAAARRDHARAAREAKVAARDLRVREPRERLHQLVMKRQRPAELKGKREHPLPRPHLGHDALGEVPRGLGHAPARAARAEAPALAREPHHAVEAAATAREVSAALREHSAVEQPAELVRDEARQRRVVVALAEKRREVIAHHRVQRRARRVARRQIRAAAEARHPAAESTRGAGCFALKSRWIQARRWRRWRRSAGGGRWALASPAPGEVLGGRPERSAASLACRRARSP
jgi:hypothetical protein